MKIFAIIRCSFLSLLLASCVSSHEGMQRLILTDGSRNVTVWVEVADEPHEYRIGLQGRVKLPRDQGMLFVFDFPKPLSFWMKQTFIPLDVLFFDESGMFDGSQTMEPCMSDPCTIYTSPRPAKYALEVNTGFVVKEGIGDGWKLMMGVQ